MSKKITYYIPNEMIDVLIYYSPALSKASLQIALLILRKTIGFNKEWDSMARSQIEERTGLSETSIKRGISELLKYKIISRRSLLKGRGYAPSYKLNEQKGGRVVTLLYTSAHSDNENEQKGVSRQTPFATSDYSDAENMEKGVSRQTPFDVENSQKRTLYFADNSNKKQKKGVSRQAPYGVKTDITTKSGKRGPSSYPYKYKASQLANSEEEKKPRDPITKKEASQVLTGKKPVDIPQVIWEKAVSVALARPNVRYPLALAEKIAREDLMPNYKPENKRFDDERRMETKADGGSYTEYELEKLKELEGVVGDE